MRLVDALRGISNGQGGDLASLMPDISRHVEGLGVDPDALRALRGGSGRKIPEGEQE